ncbi:MAG TPA: NupC/NupG family nucleoside CNT transporter [Elusimicrobia bacterium]|nr:NupC/NupG family nucleoside CNT transporter [Elusimicrobiota bacterium]HBT62516.1 NupC/NupG family nucleoside CNT transporter [Elusimicrobiota bacterium]
MNRYQWMSVFGTIAMMALAGLFCRNRKAVNLRTVFWGVALQFVFAVLILKTVPGRWIFDQVNVIVTGLLDFQTEGGKFVFGGLSVPPGQPGSMGFFFAFQVLTTIIFLSTLMSVLYYLGIMQKVVLFFARIMAFTCRTSGAESLCASANIFVGQTEAPLLIKPYIEDMTESEFLCMMTGGMATIAGGVMVAYAGMLRPYFPDAAGHLLAASVMSAPAALLIAKLMIPETEKPRTMGTLKLDYRESHVNIIDAAAAGASMGVQLAINVGAMLVAFMSLLAMANWGLHFICGFAGHPEIGFETVLGWLFSPMAWIMGTPWSECQVIGRLIGEKTFFNEFVAYSNLAKYAGEHGGNGALSQRAWVICIYALCGFSNFLSIAIQIGGIGPMAPKRKRDLARLGMKALIGGSLACFVTATIVGILIP